MLSEAPLSSDLQIPVQKEVFDIIQLYKDEFSDYSPVGVVDKSVEQEIESETQPVSEPVPIGENSQEVTLAKTIPIVSSDPVPNEIKVNFVEAPLVENHPIKVELVVPGEAVVEPEPIRQSPRPVPIGEYVTVEPMKIEEPNIVAPVGNFSQYPGQVLVGNNVVITPVHKKLAMQQNVLGTTKIPEEITTQGRIVSVSKDYFLWSRKGVLTLLDRHQYAKFQLQTQKGVVVTKLFKTDSSTEHNRFVSASKDGRMVIWSIKEGQRAVPENIIQILGDNRYVSNCCWHPTKKSVLLCVTNDNEVFQLLLHQLKEMTLLEPNTKGYSVISGPNPDVQTVDIAYSKCSKFIGCAVASGAVHIWESITFQLLQTIQVEGNVVGSFNFHGSNDSPIIIVGGTNNSSLHVYKKNGSNFELTQSVSIEYPSFQPHGVHVSGNFVFLHDLTGSSFKILHVGKHGKNYLFDYFVEYENEVSTKSMASFLDETTYFCIGLNELQTWISQLSVVEMYSQEHIDSVIIPGKTEHKPVKSTLHETNVVVEQVPPSSNVEPIEEAPLVEVTQSATEIKPIASGEIASELRRIESGLISRFEKMLESHSQKSFTKLMTEFEKKRNEMNRQDEVRREKMLEDFSSTFQEEINSTIVKSLGKVTKEKIIPMMDVSLNAIIQKEVKLIKEQIMKAQQTQMAEFSKKFEGQMSNLVTKMEKPIRESILLSIKSILPQTMDDLSSSLGHKMDELSHTLQQINSETFKILERKLGEIGTPKGDVMVGNRIHEEIAHLLRSDKWDDAFHKVLKERDLTLLNWFTKQVNPEHLENINLNHGIMLAMMQQISCDLDTDRELKMQWLYQGSLYLDPSDLVVRQQARVLGEVFENLKGSPDSTETYRMVLKSISALIKKINK